MASARAVRIGIVVHRWSALLSTVVLLVLCVTGLPLVFRDEIVGMLEPAAGQVGAPGKARADLDAMVAAARGPQGLFPGETVRWISFEQGRHEVWVALAPSYDAARRFDHVVRFDAATGHPNVVRLSRAAAPVSVLGVVLRLHTELLFGSTGEWVLFVMAVLLVVATVSGVVLYSPYMRRLDFGTVRSDRGKRIRWLDLHNLLGICTAVWVLVVGITGALNAVADPAYDRWRTAALAEALAPYVHEPMPKVTGSVEAAVRLAEAAMPGMRIRSVRYPDAELGSPHHYLVWAVGNTPLTSRLFAPVLVDARTGALVPVAAVPWHLKAIQLSRPLHFGDYGGLPLKLIWAALDILTVMVLATGIGLWFKRRPVLRESARLRRGALQRR